MTAMYTSRNRTCAEQMICQTEPRMVALSPYQEIIQMGEPVAPLILNDLSDSGDHWFTALHAITRANPVSDKSTGKIDEMRKAWISWGKAKGYISR